MFSALNCRIRFRFQEANLVEYLRNYNSHEVNFVLNGFCNCESNVFKFLCFNRAMEFTCAQVLIASLVYMKYFSVPKWPNYLIQYTILQYFCKCVFMTYMFILICPKTAIPLRKLKLITGLQSLLNES